MKIERKTMRIPERTHFKIKVESSKMGMSLQEFLDYLVDKHIEELKDDK